MIVIQIDILIEISLLQRIQVLITVLLSMVEEVLIRGEREKVVE